MAITVWRYTRGYSWFCVVLRGFQKMRIYAIKCSLIRLSGENRDIMKLPKKLLSLFLANLTLAGGLPFLRHKINHLPPGGFLMI